MIEVGFKYPLSYLFYIQMECELKISLYCKRRFKEEEVKYIDMKPCCWNCYWIKKNKNKAERAIKQKDLNT